MATNWLKKRANAAKTLKKSGQLITLMKEVGAIINKSTGVQTAPSFKHSEEVYGVALDYSKEEVNGETVLRTDQKLILEYSELVPEVGMLAEVAGIRWKIISVQPLAPAGVTVMNTCQIRI